MEIKETVGIKIFSGVGNFFSGNLVEWGSQVSEELISRKRGAYKTGRGWVDQIFTLNQTNESRLVK